MRAAAVLIGGVLLAACVPALPGGTLDEGAAGTTGSGGQGGMAGVAGGPIAGAPATAFQLVADAGRPLNVAVAGDYVYWCSIRTNALMKASVNDGKPYVLSMSCSGYSFVAVGAGSVYCTGVAESSTGRIVKVPLDGSPPTNITSAPFPKQIAVGPDAVYWITSGEVMKVGLDGGSPTPLATGQVAASAIALDATNVYWLTANDDTVRKVPMSGGQPVELGRGMNAPNPAASLAVDATSVYWTGRGTILKVGLDGGPVQGAFTAPGPAGSVTADASGVYWTDQVGGAWATTPVGGSRILGSAGSPPSFGITTDAKYVYWIATGAGSIFKAPK